jgi:hypothetical protein
MMKEKDKKTGMTRYFNTITIVEKRERKKTVKKIVPIYCPFCGSENHQINEFWIGPRFSVECKGCKTKGPEIQTDYEGNNGENLAKIAWNKRFVK